MILIRPTTRDQMSKMLLVLGVVLIGGGEGLCIVGPLRYEHIIHITCHIILYSGVMVCVLGALLHYKGFR